MRNEIKYPESVKLQNQGSEVKLGRSSWRKEPSSEAVSRIFLPWAKGEILSVFIKNRSVFVGPCAECLDRQTARHLLESLQYPT